MIFKNEGSKFEFIIDFFFFTQGQNFAYTSLIIGWKSFSTMLFRPTLLF